MSLRRDVTLAARAKRAGASHSLRIVWEARRARIPVSLAFALVEQESAFRNIFGHDAGALPALKGKRVTKKRVGLLLASLGNGFASNGVGLTQLTSPEYIRRADRIGGAHIPKFQLRVGFGLVCDRTERFGLRDGLAAYNGGEGGRWRQAPQLYAQSVVRKRDRWHRVLTKGD